MSSQDVTQLLDEVRSGDRTAFDRLFSVVYDELHQIAHARLRHHAPSETLNTTALVHETYLKLVDAERATLQDRVHFYALAARAMRFVLVDHARAGSAAKRGGGARPVTLDPGQLAARQRAVDMIELNEALERLAAADERLARLVEYRFFGGMTYEEIGQMTERSAKTAKRDWIRARAWLHRLMRTD